MGEVWNFKSSFSVSRSISPLPVSTMLAKSLKARCSFVDKKRVPILPSADIRLAYNPSGMSENSACQTASVLAMQTSAATDCRHVYLPAFSSKRRHLLELLGLVFISAIRTPPRSRASRGNAYQDAFRPCSAKKWPNQKPTPNRWISLDKSPLILAYVQN